jgi:hypothetical protein
MDHASGDGNEPDGLPDDLGVGDDPGSGEEYLKITMENAMISSCQVNASGDQTVEPGDLANAPGFIGVGELKEPSDPEAGGEIIPKLEIDQTASDGDRAAGEEGIGIGEGDASSDSFFDIFLDAGEPTTVISLSESTADEIGAAVEAEVDARVELDVDPDAGGGVDDPIEDRPNTTPGSFDQGIRVAVLGPIDR